MDRLCLALESEIDSSQDFNLFCLKEPDLELRQIIDRQPRNRQEQGPPTRSRWDMLPSSTAGHTSGALLVP